MLYDIVDQLKEHEEKSRKKKHVRVAHFYRQAWQEITRTRDKTARLEWMLSIAAEAIAAKGDDPPEEVLRWVEERFRKAAAEVAAQPAPEPDAMQQELEGLRQSNQQHLTQITALSKEIDKLKTTLENLRIERSVIGTKLEAEQAKNHNFIVALNAFLEPNK